MNSNILKLGNVLKIYSEEPHELQITPEDVLRGQGADPEVIKARNPKLYTLALKALEEGKGLLNPAFLMKEVPILEIRHQKIVLPNDLDVSGELVAQHLSPAQFLVVIICTIGKMLDNHVSRVSSTDLVEALAFDGLGSAAVEALANSICHHLEAKVKEMGLETTMPLSPGMIGWPVEQGQPQLFNILNPKEINVELTSEFVMKPRKTLSMVIGIGSNIQLSGTTCDYCSMRETCRYRGHQSNV